MDYETLICTQCNKKWNRPKSRGKKPKFCSTCKDPQQLSHTIDLEDDIDYEIPLIQEDPPPPTKYKPNTKWICHSCGAFVKTGVGVNLPPTHSCKKRLRKIYPLEKL